MAVWPIKEAKSRFRELLEDARSSGPQIITHHGRERAVVLSITEYRALAATQPDLKSYLLGGPKVDDFTVEHDPDTGRDITF
jgi:prevent-host-death family protein